MDKSIIEKSYPTKWGPLRYRVIVVMLQSIITFILLYHVLVYSGTMFSVYIKYYISINEEIKEGGDMREK